MDGNQAAAYAAYPFTEVAGIYPITPSSPMAEYIDDWASKGKKNLFGMPVKVVEMQSEGGAAGTVHGSLQAGALTTTFTASQGLLLKIPNMYKMAGELLPAVIQVSARSLATHALSIFGDHRDVMACRQTGFAMLTSAGVQEVMDLAGVAHLAAIKSSVPFLHFFDGFRTSHEIQKIELMDYDVYKRLIDLDAVKKFRKRSLNPNRPVEKGSAQNDDVYFQNAEAQNEYYNRVPDIVKYYMDEISKATGRNYAPFTYYGDPEATDVIIAMGSVNECIKEVIDYKTARGEKVGAINVHLYRPFSAKYFFAAMPKTVKRIAVLDRTKEPGAVAEPLYLDVAGIYSGMKDAPMIIGGRYGLSSKDTTPAQIFAVYKNLSLGKDAKDHFTVGINDDVTHLSLPLDKEIDVAGSGVSQLLFFGLGSDGTVGANKNTIKLIGDNTDNYAQAYFAYDSRKSGGFTRSHLRFSKNPIRSTYLINQADFVACSLDTYLHKYDMLSQLKPNGTFLLNTTKSVEEIIDYLPNAFKVQLAEKQAKFFVIDATTLARKIGLGNRTNTIMQSAFFKLNPQIMPYERAKELMKEYAYKAYSKKGPEIVELNYKAIEQGAGALVEIKVDPAWKYLACRAEKASCDVPDFVKEIANPINKAKGYDLPVSAFVKYADGTMASGTTAYEKREVSTFVPVWNPEYCIQCNQCSFVCSHAVIRPFLVTESEAQGAPKSAKYLKPVGKGLDGLKYTVQISAADCVGCESCVNQCPGRKDKDGTVHKALSMVNVDELHKNQTFKDSEYFFNHVSYKTDLVDIMASAKNSQFAQPLFEFSGACGGCGETPYIKLITQLFGDRMIVANATGCSSIYGASYPSSPYTKNKEGKGPAWANSLFEDNAEFGFGMKMAYEAIRDRLANYLVELLDDETVKCEIRDMARKWLENRKDAKITKEISRDLPLLLERENDSRFDKILELKDYLVKSSQWIFGGDGWGYDIGFGGLDHVIASNADVNILIVDTEVYSNTGGQSSKASPTASIAKFTASGKVGKKKDIGAMAMSYGHVYVATIAHGASQQQMLKAIKEAESYDGPSLIIAYSPCINHGLKRGMGKSQEQAKLAVECGYWPLYRFDPRREKEGLNPFQLDYNTPHWEKYEQHLMTETRYAQLRRVNPEHADDLLKTNREEAQRRYAMYLRYLAMDYSKK